MSGKGKKNRDGKLNQRTSPAQKVTPPASASTPVTALQTQVPTENDKKQNRWVNVSLMGAAASLLTSIASAVFAFYSMREAAQANAIARSAQDRAAGKVQARFEWVEEKHRDTSRDKMHMRKKDGYDEDVFRIENVDELVRWAPHVNIKNTGTEPIDGIKTEVNYWSGAAYGKGVKQIYPNPYVYNAPSTHEDTGFGKLLSEQVATIDLATLFLNQISRLKWEDYPEKDHVGIFTVIVDCRLVGATSYDRMADRQPLVFTFHWRPMGFKSDSKNVKNLLELRPSIRVR